MTPVPPPDPPSAPVTKADLKQHEVHEEVTFAKLISAAFGRIFKREAVAMIGVLVVGGAAALGARALGQSEIDAGAAKAVAPIVERAARAETRLDKLEGAVGTMNERVVRTETMTQMLLERVGLTPPPPVAPRDGGP